MENSEQKVRSGLVYLQNFIFIYVTLLTTSFYMKLIIGSWTWGFASLLFILPELIVGVVYLFIILTIMVLFDKDLKNVERINKR